MKQTFFLRLARTSLVFTIGMLLFGACQPKKDNQPRITGSVYVANEGAFGNSNSSVSVFNPQTKGLTAQANVSNLGGSLNSILLDRDRLFLTIQTSGNTNDKIEVLDANNYTSIASIRSTGNNRMIIPRNCAVVANKLYVSNWGAFDPSFNNPNSFVLVVDLSTNAIINSISVPNGAEGLLAVGSNLYVAQSQASTLSVINTGTDAVTGTIQVPLGPKQMVLDRNNKIWVICNGTFSSPRSNLVRINPSTNAIEATYTLANPPANGIGINPARNLVYFTVRRPSTNTHDVFALDINTPEGNTTQNALASRDRVYGFNIDPKDGSIYLGIAPNFSSNGSVVRLLPDGTEGDSFTAGIGPKGFVFK